MDWRKWTRDALGSRVTLTNIAPATSHYGAGSLDAAPEARPWLIIKMTDDNPVPGIKLARFQGAEIWVYDNPGSYSRIDSLLEEIRLALLASRPVTDGMVAIWQGNSPELADDQFGAITRFASFRLVGSGREV